MSGVYECRVAHSRLLPKRHSFWYRVFMIEVELDEIPALARRIPWLGHNRFNLFSIDDADHVDVGEAGGIRGNLVKWLAGQGVECADDARVRLVSFPRVLGYGFNPVSFYYIESGEGVPLAAVAEVTNTFREMKLYLLNGRGADGRWHRRVAKDFYVSPFSDPGLDFDFRLGAPGESWDVNIDVHDADRCMLVSSIHGRRRELTAARLLGYAIKYPLLSLRIIFLIHWHALRLWVRKVPFFRKTDRIEAQSGVMRPHISLKHTPP